MVADAFDNTAFGGGDEDGRNQFLHPVFHKEMMKL